MEKTNPALAALAGLKKSAIGNGAQTENAAKEAAAVKKTSKPADAPVSKPVKKEKTTEKPKPAAEKSASAKENRSGSSFEKYDITELMIRYRHKSKERGVQKSVYFSKDVYDYIQAYVDEEGESFAQVLDLLLRKAITK